MRVRLRNAASRLDSGSSNRKILGSLTMARDGDALPLAAGKLGGLAFEQRPDLQHPCGGLDLARDLVGRRSDVPQPERDVLAHGHVWVQRVMLEHHGGAPVARRHRVDAARADVDFAAAQRFQPGYHSQQRGLAAAGRPDEHRELAVGDFE